VSDSFDRHSLDRLTFFSDAVFAIAMTLLVVEVRLPDVARPFSEVALANALLGLIPQYVGFVISFFVVGRFWVGHHRFFARLARSDDMLVSLNLLLLLTIAFMPFPTTLISHFIDSRVGVGVYAGWLVLAGIANVLLERHAVRAGLARPEAAAEVRRLARGGWAPVAVGVLAFGAAMIAPLLALIPLGLSPVIVRLIAPPPRKPKALPPA